MGMKQIPGLSIYENHSPTELTGAEPAVLTVLLVIIAISKCTNRCSSDAKVYKLWYTEKRRRKTRDILYKGDITTG